MLQGVHRLGCARDGAVQPFGGDDDGAADHGVSEAIYLSDPDGNGLELYVDRDPAEWPRDAKGELAMTTGPLDLEALLALK